jgi:hypothetical protein
MVLAIALIVAGHYGLLWIPGLGFVGSLSVLWRDRIGRRHLFGGDEPEVPPSESDDA